MYSNCLFEAIKAKIKDPKNVRIIKLPKVASDRGHWGWTDGEYFYHSYNTNRKWYNKWWHPSKTKKVEFYVFESFIFGYLNYTSLKYKKKNMKKLYLHTNDFISNEWQCSFPNPKSRNKLPKEADVKYLEKVLRNTAYFKISKENTPPMFVNYEQLIKLEGVFHWKWVSILDEDFESIYLIDKTYTFNDML